MCGSLKLFQGVLQIMLCYCRTSTVRFKSTSTYVAFVMEINLICPFFSVPNSLAHAGVQKFNLDQNDPYLEILCFQSNIGLDNPKSFTSFPDYLIWIILTTQHNEGYELCKDLFKIVFKDRQKTRHNPKISFPSPFF